MEVDSNLKADCTTAGTKVLDCEDCDSVITLNVPALGHDYVEDTDAATAATCAAAATKTYNCSRCTASYTVSVGDKLTGNDAHNFSAWVVKESATSTSIGYRTRECSVCGKLEVETIAATGEHVLDKVTDRKEATCTADGYISYKCSAHTDCGITDTVTIPALGHEKATDYKAATCTEAGYANTICTVCNEVLVKKAIPALEHAWNEGKVTSATCNEDGKIEYTCTRTDCGATHVTVIPKNYVSHDFATTTTAATCEKEGTAVTACTRCGYVTNTTKLAKLDHTWGDTPETVVDATCTANGSETYVCQKCDATKVETLLATGHNWGEWAVSKESTNTEKGEIKRTCQTDGCQESETIEIPAGNHNLVVDTDKSTDSTCIAEGKTVYKCENHTDCGITLTVNLAKLQHDMEKTQEAATCEGDGSVVVKCNNCDTETYTAVIPATGHSYEGVVTKAPSCTAEGLKTYTCAHDADHAYTEVIAKTQHKYEAGAAAAATCVDSAYVPYKCADCDSSYVIVTGSATGHNYEKTASTATCTTAGVMTLTCTDCTKTITAEVPALGHDYQPHSTTAASCAAAATETYKCSRCNANYTVSVGAKTTAHDWNDWITAEEATNTSLGYKTRTCKVCDQLEVETIPATGEHVFDVLESEKAADCENAGEKVYSCSAHPDCGLTSTVVVPATGHKEALKYTAASCTAEGSAVMYCETCSKELDSKSIPVLEHVWGNEKITLSTCKEGGKVEYTCTNCNTATKTVDLPVNEDAHEFTETVNPATCTQPGSFVVNCTLCNKELAKTELPALQHTWSEWTVTRAATNAQDGEMTRYCGSGCIERVTFPAGGHEFGSTPDEVNPATCTANGTAVYNCIKHADCGVTITVTLDKIQHSLDKDVKNATCTDDGYVKVFCTECGEEFANVVTNKIAHVFEVVDETDPTCTSSGYKTYKCKTCDESYNEISGDANTHAYKVVEGTSTATCTSGGKVTLKCDCGATMEADVVALGHDYQLQSTTDATCAAAATETYKCTRCDASYTISVGNKTEAHDWNDWVTVEAATYTSLGYKTRTCKICGKLEVETIPATGDHVLVEVSRDDATCEETGTIYYKCNTHTDCGVTDTTEIPALGHTEKLEYKAATCTEAGYAKRICTVCDKVLESIEIPALGHAFNSSSVTKQPTCLDEGEITYTCVCGETKTEVLAAAGHTLTTVTEDAKCETEGSVVITCSKCTFRDETTLAKKGHIWGDTPISSVDASCTKDGSKTYKCTNCDKENTVVVPKLGHSYKAGTAIAPTCTASGYVPYTCDICNDTYNVYDASNPATGHSWKATSRVDASCTEDGSVAYKCENCTETKTEVTPKLGHEWGEWVISTQPTADADGIKTRKCARGCEETVTLPKLGHEMIVDSAKSVAPTCTEKGKDVYVCKTHADCGYTYEVKVSALGHSFDGGVVTTAPTCEDDGEKTYTCGCGATKTEVVPKTGHTLSTVVTDAKCEEPGTVETTCSKCSYGFTSEISAKGHNVSVTTIPATCTSEGSVTEECTNCTAYKKVTAIDKLNHDFSGTETVVTPATCTEDGEKTIQCTACDATITAVIPHLGHTWGPWTETAYGEMTRTCSRGECTENVSIPTGGHVMDKGTVTKQPTCSETGTMLMVCTAHSSCGVSIEITLDKLQHTVSLQKKEATCDEGGYVKAYCSVCGAEFETVTTAIGAHDWDEGTPVAPTCSTSGYTLYVCKYNSDHTYKEYDETKPALGHTDKAPHDGICDECSQVLCEHTNTKTEIENEVAETCTKDGSYDKIVICTDCYAVVSRETVIVPATGKHIFENYVPDGNATCGKDGTKTAECIYGCGATDTVKDIDSAKQHKWSEWQVAQKATCTTYEILTSICALCGETRVTENYKKGLAPHSFVIIEGVPATCLAPGSSDYARCVICNVVEGASVLPQLSHKDLNADGKCDMCDGAYFGDNNTKICDCLCHKDGGFMEFIYKFVRFFWKLFGSNRSCECGAVHY